MEIPKDLNAIKGAYMVAKNENNKPEMNRLKQEALIAMRNDAPVSKVESKCSSLTDSSRSKYDSLEISEAGRQISKAGSASQLIN